MEAKRPDAEGIVKFKKKMEIKKSLSKVFTKY